MPKSKLTKRADGRYKKSIIDHRTGKRIYFYGKTEAEINRKILEYTIKDEKGRTFREVADEWWEDAEPQLAVQTVHGYVVAYKRALEYLGSKYIKEIVPKDISALLYSLAKKGFAGKTVSNQLLIINLIFKHAVMQGDVLVNPCSSVQKPKDLKKTTRNAALPSEEEIIRNSSDIWLFPFIAIYTGMRKGEILALCWSDIDFINNKISVTKSLAFDVDRPFVKSPKTTAGNREVPLLEPLRKVLLNIPAAQRKANNYLIADKHGLPLTKSQYETRMNDYLAKTGVTCTAHQLRHSFATICFESGLPPKTIQELLGHRQLSTTMDIYTQFRDKAFDDARDILNKKLTS